MDLVWFCYVFNMGFVWFGYGFGVVLVCFWYVVGMVLVWLSNGFVDVSLDELLWVLWVLGRFGDGGGNWI